MVKSSWRHVRSHLYFTSASHMYTLLNTLKLGVDSLIVDESDRESRGRLDRILRMDFCSHFVFRLFENLNVEEDNPARFNLEIMINRGAACDSTEIMKVKHHKVPIKLDQYIDINKKLDLEKLNHFLVSLRELDPTISSSSSLSSKDKKKKKDKDSPKSEPKMKESEMLPQI